MASISTLEKQIEKATALLEEAEASITPGPTNFARELTVKSYRSHVAQLRAELRQEKLDRAVEVVQLRLKGRLAHNGSLPLQLLAKISAELASAIQASAQKLTTGKRVRRITPEIVSELDLRLAALTSGSTNLVVTGNLNPDLFGYSVLEESLHEVFALLNADVETQLADHVASVGIRGAHEIRDLLRTLHDSNLEVDMTWRSPASGTIRWQGNHHRISLTSSMLGNFEVSEPEELDLSGIAVTVSLRRPFEMDAGGSLITASVPLELMERVQAVHAGQEIRAKVLRNVVVNAITGTEKVDYTLLDVRPREG